MRPVPTGTGLICLPDAPRRAASVSRSLARLATITVVGAPAYRVPGCMDSLHRSFIVIRTDSRAQALDDLRATRFAINELFAPLARDGRFFASTVVTGSHAASAMAVAAGEADAAAIDCVTFALLGRYRPAAILRTSRHRPDPPTPPLVTARSSAPHVVAALRPAMALFLSDIGFCGDSAYRVVMRYEDEACDPVTARARSSMPPGVRTRYDRERTRTVRRQTSRRAPFGRQHRHGRSQTIRPERTVSSS